jgi:hypothetical protein
VESRGERRGLGLAVNTSLDPGHMPPLSLSAFCLFSVCSLYTLLWMENKREKYSLKKVCVIEFYSVFKFGYRTSSYCLRTISNYLFI